MNDKSKTPLAEMMEQAMQAGLKLQEESSKWWTESLAQSATPADWQKRWSASPSDAIRLVQKRMQLQMSLQTGPPKGTITSGHVVTVAEKVSILRARLNKLGEEGRLPLAEEFEAAAMRSRTEIVVLFMAVLELVRRKMAWAEQDELFGEIWLRRRA